LPESLLSHMKTVLNNRSPDLSIDK
jgi:hypothetical protein